MDRRNGGDTAAPPRPPKLLPRVHRPRAPEPATAAPPPPPTTTPAAAMRDRTTTTAAAAAAAAAANQPKCTNCNKGVAEQQQQQQQQHLVGSSSSNNNINNNSSSSSSSSNTNTNKATSHSIMSEGGGGGALTQPNLSNSSISHNLFIIPNADTEVDEHPTHHLTFLPQRPTSLSRNSSHASITAASSFTRRRLPPMPVPVPAPMPMPGAAVPLLAISPAATPPTNAAAIATTTTTATAAATATATATATTAAMASPNPASSSLNDAHSSHALTSFLSHFHSAEPAAAAAAASPVAAITPPTAAEAPSASVTLAQPRPESERLTNEYVETPIRCAQQLQHASRAQHPAGQHDNGQTTTHHLLLLPQRTPAAHQHQQHQQQQQALRGMGAAGAAAAQAAAAGMAGTAGSATAPIDGLLHSHKAPPESGQGGKAKPLPLPPMPPPPPLPPITKQPTSGSMGRHPCKPNALGKETHSLDELFELPIGLPPTVNGAGMNEALALGLTGGPGSLGRSVTLGGATHTHPLHSITCPRCHRCRCEQCRSPRPLPESWVCNKRFLCSADTIIDYASCLCCAKGLFYHCGADRDYAGGASASHNENPCSCSPYRRVQRWGWLGALSLVMPCLWCYWPMRGCQKVTEYCYDRAIGRGCRCQYSGGGGLAGVPLALRMGMANGSMGSGGTNTAINTSTSLDGTGTHASHADIIGLGLGLGLGLGMGMGMGMGLGLADGQHNPVKVMAHGMPPGCGGQLHTNNHSHNHNHNHHHGNGMASRILRKGGDTTPEKRLLDSSPEY